MMPNWLQRHVLHFEASIEDAVREFSAGLPEGARVLDAGAGESQYAECFANHRYVAVDLGIGDQTWEYSHLDAIADLEHLPFSENAFDACVNIVTLEHVREPALVLGELSRVLRPGGRLLLVTPLEWEEHQQPHDYFRYTRHGLEYLLSKAGLRVDRIEPVGGFFRLLSRRLMNAPQFGVAGALIGIASAPIALTLPLLDGLDRSKHFTLGHISIAAKP
jgi:SAM-dependent methyltransferase